MSDLEIVKEFLVESYENLDRLDRDLLELEKDPTASEIVASIFRTIHTIKGTCGFLGFKHLEEVAHAGENLLARLRDGQLQLNEEIATALLKLVDSVREMLSSIESHGSEGERDDAELIGSLTRLLEGAQTTTGCTPPLAVVSQSKPAAPEGGLRIVLAPEVEGEPTAKQKTDGDLQAHTEGQGDKMPPRAPETGEALAVHNKPHVGDTTIRVDVSLLDQLMNLVGELVLARNQILQFTNAAKEAGLLATSQRLNLITTELQEGVMKTRMQPIGNVWSKFPRVVRDLALGCGKQVHIEMEGKETELDKTIIEAIKDPLTHLVRNAVDHGIESPEVRKQAGKNPEGRLFLRAFHEGGQVNIEISDDGAGLDLNKIRNKAVQKGLISSDQALRMGDREVANLIFLAGLSTAEKVTNVSGRGVGMDVVKTNIEKIGGTVDVQSKPGQGSTVRVKIPLTLAIIPALMVTSGGDRYAIPQVSLLELVRIDGENTRKSIELIHGSPVYRLRGRLLPLVYLNRELNVGRSAERDRSPGGGASGQTAIDLAEARSEHELWIGRLRQVLDGKFSLSLDQAGSSRDCALGKWLDSCGLKSYGDIEEIRILEETHRRFHAAAREVVACQERADVAGESEFARAKRLSTQIIDLLAVVEKKIAESQSVNIVVLQAEDRQFGLVVDAISDTEEIVVKPLRKHIKGINAYSGATILGDGRVALILDVLGLAQRANVVRESRDAAVAEKEGAPASAIGERSGHTVLLFQNGERERMAIELSQVARLEEFSCEAIEIVGGREVVQYRGQIMPLLHLSQFFGSAGAAEGDALRPVQVVVYSEDGHTVGLIVDRILDIIEDAFQIQPDTGRSGVLGSAVIQKRTTEILDIRSLVAGVAQS